MFQPVSCRAIHHEQSAFYDKVSYKMQVHQPVNQEYEEKDKSTKLFVWPYLQNHILLECFQILTKLIYHINLQFLVTKIITINLEQTKLLQINPNSKHKLSETLLFPQQIIKGVIKDVFI